MSCFSANAAKGKIIYHEIPCKPCQVIGADMFTLHIKNYPWYCRLSQQVPSHQKDGRPTSR